MNLTETILEAYRHPQVVVRRAQMYIEREDGGKKMEDDYKLVDFLFSE